MKSVRESDWKKFTAMIPKLRERYLVTCNARIAGLLADPRKTETERFWDAHEAMEKEAKLLHHCLDGYSRSTLWSYIISMIRHGMLTRDDCAQFSEDLQAELSYAFDKKKD